MLLLLYMLTEGTQVTVVGGWNPECARLELKPSLAHLPR